jgi:hypothetical protein
MVTNGHGGKLLSEIADECGLATGAVDGDEDRTCAICRGEACIACAKMGRDDAYDCEHDTDEQHGWDK